MAAGSVRGLVLLILCALFASPLSAGETAGIQLDWKRVATASDMARIKAWRTAFVKALEGVRARGDGGRIASGDALFDPDAALGGDGPPPGRYSCRVFKLGSQSPAMPSYTEYPAFTCLIADEGEVRSFAKMGGSQRPVGLIFSGDGRRDIFLGTMLLGDEKRPMDYGMDSTRDMAGIVERIGPQRWRLVLPYPRFESLTDIVELITQE